MREIVYSQPEQYRFSQTTLLAAKIVSQILGAKQAEKINVLDLFAGSGFFSLEAILSSSLQSSVVLTLLELQEVFHSHLQHNTSKANAIYPELKTQIHLMDARTWMEEQQETWDYILLNPPHYFNHEVILPADPVRAKCHTIEQLQWIKILKNLRKISGPQTALLMHLNFTSVLYNTTTNFFKDCLIQRHPLLRNEELLVLNFGDERTQ